MPLLERILGLASDLRLRDLASLNHPALKELIVQAPGTWHHSVVAGALAEAGADAIGADALLARVGAHYHDLGKGDRPGLLHREHPRREPAGRAAAAGPARSGCGATSTTGVAAARRWKLPRAVVDIVRAAPRDPARLLLLVEGPPARATPTATSTPSFRYGGPRPQTREAGLVMIADACEASSRELPETSPERLLHLVRRRISEIVDEGQLDESELTIGDLDAIARAMASALDAVYRARSAGASQPPSPPDRAASLQLVRP